MRPTLRPLPGLAVLLVLALLARGIGLRAPLSPLVVAIASGALVAALVGTPDWARPGLEKYKLLLETGIVLLGAQLTLGQLVETGPVVVGLAAMVVLVGVVFVELVGRWAGIAARTRSLLAAGASVCGVSAVLAVAGSIEGDEADISYAAGTILLFDAATLIVFPLFASVLGLSDRLFGVWAGLSLFSTGPAAAVGFAVSGTAGQWATVTKLVRNTFIGVLAVGYAIHHAAGGGERGKPTEIWSKFPKFLIGFLAVAFIVNAGLVDQSTLVVVESAGDWLFTLAFVGLGFELNPRRLKATGVTPVLVVLAHLVTVSALALLAVTVLL